MRLERISLQNYRCLRSETISIDEYTAFVGPNNCGKSTILRAIGNFYECRKFELSDFSVVSPEEDICIRFEFSDLSAEAATDLGHYVRNGRVAFDLQGFRKEGDNIETRCRGIRYGLLEVAPFFAVSSAGERKPIYERLKADGADLPEWQNQSSAEAAVRAFESQQIDRHVAIPSEENAYGVAGPIAKIRRHLEWIYIPAVKEASSEAEESRNSSFSKLVLAAVKSKHNFADRISAIQEDAIRELRTAIDDAEEVLSEISGEIDRSFKALNTSNVDIALKWNDPDSLIMKEPSISTFFKDGAVRGSPNDFGHGIQRTYLMALISLAARATNSNSNQRLLIGVEEPELYQHPPQARYLSNSLVELSQARNQVLVTTHSPYFIMGRNFNSIRSLRKRGNVTNINSWSVSEQRSHCAVRLKTDAIGEAATVSGLDRSLQIPISEIFFASKIILVEGSEDVALISAYIDAIGLRREFLSSGCHIVPVGGKSKIPMLISMARGFGIDVFTVFDMDLDQSASNQNNGVLARYAEDLDITLVPNNFGHHSSPYFFGFKSNIQNALAEEIPNWVDLAMNIATDWGWMYSRMKKDPMLMEACIERVCSGGSRIPVLDNLIERLRSFWTTSN